MSCPFQELLILTNVSLLLNGCSKDGVVLVHPTCGPTQADDIPGYVRYQTYEVRTHILSSASSVKCYCTLPLTVDPPYNRVELFTSHALKPWPDPLPSLFLMHRC